GRVPFDFWVLDRRPTVPLVSKTMPDGLVTVVLPCLNEAESLPSVLAAIPAGYQALVVDNNSTDDTAEVAPPPGVYQALVVKNNSPDDPAEGPRRHGAKVVAEPRPGYGSAVHAGV